MREPKIVESFNNAEKQIWHTNVYNFINELKVSKDSKYKALITMQFISSFIYLISIFSMTLLTLVNLTNGTMITDGQLSFIITCMTLIVVNMLIVWFTTEKIKKIERTDKLD